MGPLGYGIKLHLKGLQWYDLAIQSKKKFVFVASKLEVIALDTEMMNADELVATIQIVKK